MKNIDSTNSYEQYMNFEVLEPQVWTTSYLRDNLRILGVDESMVTYEDVEKILWCYDQSPMNRSYHGPDHGAFIGQPDVPDVLFERLSERFSLREAEAALAIAGLFHDVAYKHVDEIDEDGTRAWPTVLEDMLDSSVSYVRTVEDNKTIFRTYITETGSTDPMTQLVARLFEVGEEGIVHNKGGNEFDSALAAAKFLNTKGASMKSIIAVVSAIAATVPFKSAIETDEDGQMSDGHMGNLAQRVKISLEDMGVSLEEYVWQDTNDIMLLSVHLANRDISPFVQPNNFAQIIHGGRGVKAEEVPALRRTVKTIRELARAAGLQRSAPLLYGWLSSSNSPVPARNVPHIYIPRDREGKIGNVSESYPPLDIYHEAVEHTERNSRMANNFFVAHELGIVLATTIATQIGEPDAPVPGIVHSVKWHPDAVVKDVTHLNEEDHLVYLELLHGHGQKTIDSATSRRSPIGAIIFGSLGSGRADKLSKQLQQIREQYEGDDPFSDPDIAAAFMDTIRIQIGEDAFNTIIIEMHRTAQYFQDDPVRGKLGRAAAINALRNNPT